MQGSKSGLIGLPRATHPFATTVQSPSDALNTDFHVRTWSLALLIEIFPVWVRAAPLGHGNSLTLPTPLESISVPPNEEITRWRWCSLHVIGIISILELRASPLLHRRTGGCITVTYRLHSYIHQFEMVWLQLPPHLKSSNISKARFKFLIWFAAKDSVVAVLILLWIILTPTHLLPVPRANKETFQSLSPEL